MQMAQYYELVVYTDQLPTYADPILDRLDPNRFIQYRLYRDSTQYINGKHVSPWWCCRTDLQSYSCRERGGIYLANAVDSAA